jgi:hypothetical protein
VIERAFAMAMIFKISDRFFMGLPPATKVRKNDSHG